MLEGKTINSRQAEYLSIVEGACSAAEHLADLLIKDYPLRSDDFNAFFAEHFDDAFAIINGIHSLMECASGIFESREF